MNSRAVYAHARGILVGVDVDSGRVSVWIHRTHHGLAAPIVAKR